MGMNPSTQHRTAPTKPKPSIALALSVTLRISMIVGVGCGLSATTVLANTPLSSPVDETTLTARQRFKDAREALSKADVEGFRKIKATLTDYALFHYLEYEDLAHEFRNETPTKASVGKLNAFEADYQDASLTGKLTRTLQSRLAETEQWELFLGVSKSRLASELKCSHLRANYELGNISGFTDEVLELWVEPKQQHARCQPVLDSIEAAHTPPIKAIWERIFAAFEEDAPEFAEQMLGYLSTYERKQITNWLEALEEPEPFLDSPALKADTQLNRRRFVDLVLAWSKFDTAAAMDHWMANKDRFTFYEDRYYETHRLLALRGAYRRMPEAYEWLMSVPVRDDDLELKEWRIRAALFAQDWVEVIKTIRRLPEEEQIEDHWAYWEARAFDETGHSDKAEAIYTTLAGLQSYHGFLSADRLGQEYAIYNEPLPSFPAEYERLSKLPMLIRAREYHHTGVTWESRREWNAMLSENNSDESVAAASQLAVDWGMTDRALATAGRVQDYRRAIDIRFPTLFKDLVDTNTAERSLDPAFMLGLMRRESGFMADAKSPVGASGLMQLMPGTAKHVSEMMGIKNWAGDMTDPASNIAFGTFYFRFVLDRFDDREILAAAAYNAGPHRVAAWLPTETMAGDVWVDSIPYSETRRYVRALLAYAAIYDVQLNGTAKRLSERLDDVPAKEPEKEGA